MRQDMLRLKKKSPLKCLGVMPNDQADAVEWPCVSRNVPLEVNLSKLLRVETQEPSDHIPLVVTFALPSVEAPSRHGYRGMELWNRNIFVPKEQIRVL